MTDCLHLYALLIFVMHKIIFSYLGRMEKVASSQIVCFPQLLVEVEPFDHYVHSFIEHEKCYKNVNIMVGRGYEPDDPF